MKTAVCHRPAPCSQPESAAEWRTMFHWAFLALLEMETRAEEAEQKALLTTLRQSTRNDREQSLTDRRDFMRTLSRIAARKNRLGTIAELLQMELAGVKPCVYNDEPSPQSFPQTEAISPSLRLAEAECHVLDCCKPASIQEFHEGQEVPA